MRKAIKKITFFVIIISIFLLTIFTMIIGNNKEKAYAYDNEKNNFEKKIYYKEKADDVFADDSIIVVLDKSISKINKKIDDEFWEVMNDIRITDLTFGKGNIEKNSFLDDENFHQILKIELKEHSRENVLQAIRLFEKKNGVLYAGPNKKYCLTDQPTAATGHNYTQQWGLHGTYGVDAETAWDITTGSNQIRVGIIDNGIAEHIDLNANLVTGWNFLTNDAITTSPSDSHGTKVAGIIGATGERVEGISGVCRNVQLVPLQVTNGETFLSSNCISAISWSIFNNIHIINLSAATTEYDQPITLAIANFRGLFVCSAGNENSDNDSVKVYPSDYSQGMFFSERIISVGAIDKFGQKQVNSNYGQTTVSVFAPGSEIISTGLSNNLDFINKTSAATPFVTGTAALMMSIFEQVPHTMTLAEKAVAIKQAIMESVKKDTGNPLENLCVSGGRLDAYAALEKLIFKNQVFDEFGYYGSTYYWKGKVDMTVDYAAKCSINGNTLSLNGSRHQLKFKLSTEDNNNAWSAINGTVTFQLKNSAGEIIQIDENNTFVSTVNVNILNSVTLSNTAFTIDTLTYPNDTYTLTLTSTMTRNGWTHNYTKTFDFIVNKPQLCIAAGSLITLADGSRVAVEDLTGEEDLLVWNMLTGQYDTAPILFIDSDPLSSYEIIKLTFSDNTEVKVIDEHAFFDMTIGKYVFMRNDASQYIGHYFNKQGINGTYTTVQLINVTVYNETTTTWSPVTYGHLCYYVNGMLSMPGATEGLINIFDVDTTLMKYDAVQMAADIQTYGLYTYEEFNAIIPLPEYVFDAFNGQYLKVSIGKGLITLDEIAALLERYAAFFE